MVSTTCPYSYKINLYSKLCSSLFFVIDCGSVPSLSNGQIILSGGQIYGSLATIECNVGYSLIGLASHRCSEAGQWEPQVIPECRIKGITAN